MSRELEITVDTGPLQRAFGILDAETARLCLDACEETARSAVREMRARLQRQLGSNASGATVGGIVAERAHDGVGWVVMSDRDPFPNLPLWLEKGTKPGKRRNYARTKARPFFYVSLELEVGPHERRIVEAMTGAGERAGLG